MEYKNIEDLTRQEKLDHYYDWDCGMSYSFNGTPYPKDYPRHKGYYSLRHKGKYMTFADLKDYMTKTYPEYFESQKPMSETPYKSPFTGDMAVIDRLLQEQGLRLSRGTFRQWDGTETPTVCIDRYDTPEWQGIWTTVEECESEAQMAFCLYGNVIVKWNEDKWMYEHPCDNQPNK